MIKNSRLKWSGHSERNDNTDCVNIVRCWKLNELDRWDVQRRLGGNVSRTTWTVYETVPKGCKVQE